MDGSGGRSERRSPEPDELLDAIRMGFRLAAPRVSWRGRDTGAHALDAWYLGALVQQARPATVVVAGAVGDGGLPLYLADMLDLNGRGKLHAVEEMGRERRATMPTHRRIHYWTSAAPPALGSTFQEQALVVGPNSPAFSPLLRPGSHLVVPWGEQAPPAFEADPAMDPLGMSAYSWLRRFPR